MWFNDWHDSLRYIAVVCSAISLVVLNRKLGQSANEWSHKTRDLWFAMVLWSVTGIVLAIEGLYEDRPLEPRVVFYCLASVITVKGICTKGAWGERD